MPIVVVESTAIEPQPWRNGGGQTRELLTWPEGGQFPYCHLLDGPTRDLNLMARGGAAIMQKVDARQTWEQTFAIGGLYTEVSGCWANAHDQRALAAQSLLWAEGEDTGAWSFVPDDELSPCYAWWLGYTT